MAVKFESLKPGDILYSYEKRTMGNTKVKTISEFIVRIIEVDSEKRCALVSWNSNSPTKWREGQLKKLYRNRRPLERDHFGRASFAKNKDTEKK